MESDPQIIPLTPSQIPSILSYDRAKNDYIPDLGLSPAKFEREKKYWVLTDESARQAQASAFTAKDVTIRFLELLLAQIPKRPDALIIGEPTIRGDKGWREYFRAHVRQVFAELGLPAPQFFPEPFAVLQYYRQIAGVIPKVDAPQTILIIDFGGGTFDTCLIRTTQRGDLARSGATALPLGIQSVAVAGRDIDRGLLEVVVKRARQDGLIFKDDPIKRAEVSSIPVLFLVENAKITLSAKLHGAAYRDDCRSAKEEVVIPPGVLHPDQEVRVELTGEDLKEVINRLWHRQLGETVLRCVQEASQEIGGEVRHLDRVLLAGGSVRLPFLTELVLKTLPTLVARENVIIGDQVGEAVAYGIAVECREQINRYPALASDRIAPCILSDLYLSFSRMRRDAPMPVIVKKPRRATDGHLLAAPLETADLTAEYVLELPFSPKQQLFYWFTSQPAQMDAIESRLNLTHDVLRVPPRASRKARLKLNFSKNGLVQPTFEFAVNDSGRSAWKCVECPPFFFSDLQVVEGRRYFGLDFGTSNSYVVEFLSPLVEKPAQTAYPEFRIVPGLIERLRQVELEVSSLRGRGLLDTHRIQKHALESRLHFVFHTNKIEGSPLTKGETEDACRSDDAERLSPQQLAALNSYNAYPWVMENNALFFENPEGFIQHLNKMVLEGISEQAGRYGKGPIKISGPSFSPPPAAAVPDLMRQLALELRKEQGRRPALELATTLHTKLVWIHPFEDGNGRTARLLLNAILLARQLPIAIVNFDERERYMDGLLEVDEGDLSPLMELILECFSVSLNQCAPEDDATANETSDAIPHDKESYEGTHTTEPTPHDPIASALKEIGSPELPQTEKTDDSIPSADDILSRVMAEKLRAAQAQYEAWVQAFESVAKQAEAQTAIFNQQYAARGFTITFRRYDMLTREKYDLLAASQRAPQTWFFGLELRSSSARARFVFFFQRCSSLVRSLPGTSPVSLTLSRHDGTGYRRLSTEPIWLREITYVQGNLRTVGNTDLKPTPPIEQALRQTLAEMIKTYL